MKDDNTNPPDDFGERITGWHNLLGWGEDNESVAPYVPTPMNVVKKMLEIAEAGPGDTIIDLGCGDGRILMMAVEEFGVDHAIGYELNNHLVETALNKIYDKDLRDKIEVNRSNFMEADLSQATVITLYLTTTGNAKLRPKFIAELQKSTRIVSHDFPIIEWVTTTENNEPLRIGTHKIFSYRVPEAYTTEIKVDEKKIPPWERIKKLVDRL